VNSSRASATFRAPSLKSCLYEFAGLYSEEPKMAQSFFAVHLQFCFSHLRPRFGNHRT